MPEDMGFLWQICSETRGYGWKKGKAFEIHNISKERSRDPIYWPKGGDECGIYESFLSEYDLKMQLKKGMINAKEYTELKRKELECASK